MTARMEVDFRGIDLDETAPRQRSVVVSVDCDFHSDPGVAAADKRELEELIKAWYTVGHYQGFDGSLTQLSEIRFGESVEFKVVGTMKRDAFDALLRCLESPSHDVVVRKVSLTISEYR